MLIGVTGYAQNGKDTIGDKLCADYGFVRFGFAHALKALALAADPIVDILHGRHLSEVVENEGWEEAKRIHEVRRFLQELGTKARGLIGGDVWIRALEYKLLDAHPQNAVVTDVRFPNEADWIHRHNGFIIRVSRYEEVEAYPFTGTSRHVPVTPVDPSTESERWVPLLPADFDLLNDSTVQVLDERVDKLMQSILAERQD